MTWIANDEALVERIASAMELRRPNRDALAELAQQVSHGDGREVIADLATGVGKTYLAAALVDYLAQQGVRNILFVTPGQTILDKTVRNFTPGDSKFVPGGDVAVQLVTAQNFNNGQIGDVLHDDSVTKVYVFTVQALLPPPANAKAPKSSTGAVSQKEISRRTHEDDENIGGALYSFLRDASDLVVIADEHHTYRSQAARFHATLKDLDARAIIGLTATPDKTDEEAGKVVYRYPLAAAIADQYVKIPVVVYRADGRKDVDAQLADACLLRARREQAWADYASVTDRPAVHPVLLVVCETIADAELVSERLTRDDLLPGKDEVLLITGGSTDVALRMLADVEDPESPVRAIVSVDKLKEGWDVKNVAVIVAFRKLASQTLTEQIMGRGLRLLFGQRVGYGPIDHLDLVAHESYSELLANKNALLEQILKPEQAIPASATPVHGGEQTLDWSTGSDDTAPEAGFAVSATSDTIPGLSAGEVLLGREMEAAIKESESASDALPVPMPRNADRAPVLFPAEYKTASAVRFSLKMVDLLVAEQRGRQFRLDPQVNLVRRAIEAQRDQAGAVHVTDRVLDSIAATRSTMTTEQARAMILRLVLASGLVEADMIEQARAVELVDAFLKGADVEIGDDWEWSLDHTQRAADGLYGEVIAAYRARQSIPGFDFRIVALPTPLVKPPTVHDPWSPFVKKNWYGPFSKSLDRYAQFDSDSAERKLALRMEDWSDVDRWQRLYVGGPANLLWTKPGPYLETKDYFPDFVVVGTDGRYWVIEAKSDVAAEDSRAVTAKKEAADEWVARVNAAESYGTWGYLLATESHIAFAPNLAALIAAATV